MGLLVANNATSTLAGAIADDATSLTVDAADAALFPTPGADEWFPLTVVDGDGSMEIMRATSRAGSVINVSRGQEGTSPLALGAGARVDLRLTKAALDAKQNTSANLTTLAASLSAPRINSCTSGATLDLSGFDQVIVNRFANGTLLAPALYTKVGSEPSHGLKFQDSVGTWFEFAGGEIDIRSGGCLGDGTDDTAAFVRCLIAAEAKGIRRLVNRDASKRFMLKRIYLDDYMTDSIHVDLGGGAIVGEFKGADVPNNVANIFRTRGGYATGSFTFTGGATNTNTFTVGDTTYTLTTAGDPAALNEFWRGENAEISKEATAFALAAAINGEGRFKLISFTGASGAFVEGEDITGGTSGSVSRIEAVFYESGSSTDGIMFVLDMTVNTSNGETLTSTSGITAISHGISRNLLFSTARVNPKARARQVGDQVIVTALKEGADGNTIALAETSTGASVSGATLTGGKAGLNVTVSNGMIDGQDNGTSSSGSGEPLIEFLGGDKIIFNDLEIKNGGNRYSGADVRRLLEAKPAEVIIDGARLFQVFGGKIWSHWGEALQVQSHDASIVYQIIGTYFSKRRSSNPLALFSNSSFNAFNCSPASFMLGAQFVDHIKSATNIVHHGGTFTKLLIDGVYDSNGLDFNEAGNFRFEGAKVIDITLRNIFGVGIRTSGSNVSIDGVDEENVTNAIRFEAALGSGRRAWFEPWLNNAQDSELSCEVKRVISRGSGVRIAYDAQTAAFTVGATLTGGTSAATATILHVYDNGTTGVLLLRPPSGTFADNETITDNKGGSALVNILPTTMPVNEAVIDVRGVSADLPVQLTVDGMLDQLNPLLERHNYGIDAGNCDLTVKGHLNVGDVAPVRQDGYTRLTSWATIKCDMDAGARHGFLFDGGTIDNITLHDFKRFGVLNGGASDIRFLNSPTLNGAIHLLRPVTTPVISDASKIVYKDGVAFADYVPVLSGATSAGVGTYSVQKGSWVKTGRLVKGHVELTWSAHTGTGGIRISLPPFLASADALGAIEVWYENITHLNKLQGRIGTTSQMALSTIASGGAATNFNVVASGTLILAFSYIAAS
ncbi:hypothetical protein [Allomesorhizobium alhagi]|uniref:Pectate lyase superfamily protein domain-containing protein n=1 Tax=Mesorhizobium alhagi CCNWXJ12-2 TaxID=1107882 RepID=H0HNH8_9HYPH|nr:hypothetical protein [Mesorhizobium alhagi]EHK57750.1 hypothetical protein MAXJ12_08504 [Mesorhizobium alhagi CCNWXJ12-2]